MHINYAHTEHTLANVPWGPVYSLRLRPSYTTCKFRMACRYAAQAFNYFFPGTSWLIQVINSKDYGVIHQAVLRKKLRVLWAIFDCLVSWGVAWGGGRFQESRTVVGCISSCFIYSMYCTLNELDKENAQGG